MKTITNKNETSVISENIQVTISEDKHRIYIDVLENRENEVFSNDQVITNSLSVPKDRAIDLKLDSPDLLEENNHE